jgi:riboflavin biosynthesis pyrimidine reductase
VLVSEGAFGAEAVDDLFLTLSPQIAGRKGDTIRPGLVEGIEFVPDRSPEFQLLSVKQRAEHPYLRYGRTGGNSSDGSEQDSRFRKSP